MLGGTQALAQINQEIEAPLGMGCLAALVAEKKLAKEQETEGSYELLKGNLGAYMKLDSAAADAVMLLPDPAYPKQYGSLFQILNKCKTKMGSRLLERWLRQPLVDRKAIEARQDLVELLKDETELREGLHQGPLRNCPDLEAIKVKLTGKRAGLKEIFQMYLFTRTIPEFVQTFESFAEHASNDSMVELVASRWTKNFKETMKQFSMYQQLVEHVLDMDALPDFVVSAAYDDQLGEIKESMDEEMSTINRLHTDAAEGWCDFGKKGKCLLMQDKVRGYVFRMTNANMKSAIQKANKKAEIVQVLKNGIYFTTPELKNAAKRWKKLRAEYEEKQVGVVQKAVETASTYFSVMEVAAQAVAELDVLVSLAHVAALAPTEYVRPVLKDAGTGVLKVSGARHPCVEMQDDVEFIPNSYDMTFDKNRFMIMTGPNMGGKSTYIRTVAALVVMAQIGSFVPCESAELSIVDAVFARVGAGDNQNRGVSTFMAEMLEAGAILNTATAKSLIVIDEMGRGTSTFDGFGLAWAISEYIVERTKAFCLFATHFHEMTTLPHTHSAASNVHVSAHTTEEGIAMLYEVKPGPCLQSYGVHVAKMAGFPGSTIREAKRKAAQLERFENTLDTLQKRHKTGNGSAAEEVAETAKADAVPAGEMAGSSWVNQLSELGRKFIVSSLELRTNLTRNQHTPICT
ncbi:unnamed protein product [Chrysoparadoxa australica]